MVYIGKIRKFFGSPSSSDDFQLNFDDLSLSLEWLDKFIAILQSCNPSKLHFKTFEKKLSQLHYFHLNFSKRWLKETMILIVLYDCPKILPPYIS